MTADLWVMAWFVLVGTMALGAVVALRSARGPTPWTLLDVLLAFVALVWVSAGVAALLIRVTTGTWNAMDLGLVPTVVASAMGSAAACAVAFTRTGSVRALGFQRTSAQWIVLAVVLAFAFVGISALWVSLLQSFDIVVEEQQIASLFREEWGRPTIWVAVLYGVILAPLFEEILFRGFALPPLVRRLGVVPAIVLDGAVFGLVHMESPIAVPPLALLGALLAWMRWRSGSLVAPLVFHFTNNLVAFLSLVSSM